MTINEQKNQLPRSIELESCPKCGSEEITAGHTNSDSGALSRPASCEGCGAEWLEVFTFSHWEYPA